MELYIVPVGCGRAPAVERVGGGSSVYDVLPCDAVGLIVGSRDVYERRRDCVENSGAELYQGDQAGINGETVTW